MPKKKSRRYYHPVTKGLDHLSHPEEIMFLIDEGGYHFKVRNILCYLWSRILSRHSI